MEGHSQSEFQCKLGPLMQTKGLASKLTMNRTDFVLQSLLRAACAILVNSQIWKVRFPSPAVFFRVISASQRTNTYPYFSRQIKFHLLSVPVSLKCLVPIFLFVSCTKEEQRGETLIVTFFWNNLQSILTCFWELKSVWIPELWQEHVQTRV